MDELVIWWLCQNDYRGIGQSSSEIRETLTGVPEYIVDEVSSRFGRPGRGRLWVAKGIDLREIAWPEDNPIAIAVGDEGGYGGIVFYRRDLDSVYQYPGVFTDLELRRLK